jgi:hypothetical protein
MLEPGTWIGEGKVAFSASPEEVKFYTRWKVQKRKKDRIVCSQEVELHGIDEKIKNAFTVAEITPESFLMSLENELIGMAQGKGVITDETIGWEVKGPDNFQGYEIYEKQENGDYLFHAEYTSDDQYRTIIDGRIWKKEEENK